MEGFYEINLLAGIKRILTKWYLVLLVCVLCGTMAVGIGWFSRHKVSQEDVFNPEMLTEITSEVEAEQLRGMLSDDAMQEIDICMDRVARTQEQKVYMNEAVLMQLDPYNCKKLTVSYEVSSASMAAANYIRSQYTDFISLSDNFRKIVSEAIGDNEGKCHVSDVITVEKKDIVSSGAVAIIRFDINIMLAEEWDESAVLQAVRNGVESYNVDQYVDDAEVDCVFYDAYSTTNYIPTLKSQQDSVIAQYNNNTTYYKTATQGLDHNSALLFNYMLRQQGIENDYKVLVDDSLADDLTANNPKGFLDRFAKMSYVVLALGGACVGLLFVLGFAFVYWIVRGRAGRILGLSVMSNRPVFGVLAKKEKDKNKKKKFELTVASISLFSKHMGEGNVDIVCIGKAGKKNVDILKSLCKRLKRDNIMESKICCIDMEETDGYEAIAELNKTVILCVVYEENKVRDIIAVDKQLSALNVKILGTIGIE